MPFLHILLGQAAVAHRWHFGIGDPTFLGWFTVAAYALALHYAWFAIAVTRMSARELSARGLPSGRQERTVAHFWLATFVVLLLLGINKQLDLQTLLTDVLRDWSLQEGWFRERRVWQARFIKTLLLSGLALALFALYLLRRVLFRIRLSLLGLTVLGSFVLVRAAYFHHVLRRGGSVHWVLELCGIALVTRAAYLEAKKRAS
jgi:hypothetical protein